jgi:hypothetical protein
VRGLLGAAGLRGRRATAAHGAAIWGSAQVTLPALDFHHTVYAVATGVAYELLDGASRHAQ